MSERKAELYLADLRSLLERAQSDARTFDAANILSLAKDIAARQGFLFRSPSRSGGATVGEKDLREFWKQLNALYVERGGTEPFPEILPPQTYTAGSGLP